MKNYLYHSEWGEYLLLNLVNSISYLKMVKLASIYILTLSNYTYIPIIFTNSFS